MARQHVGVEVGVEERAERKRKRGTSGVVEEPTRMDAGEM